MRLVANKPCSFGGKKFLIGEEVPADLVLNPTEQEKRGILTKLIGSADAEPVAEVGQVKFAIPIHGEAGDVEIQVTNDELVVFTEIRQNPAKKAEEKKRIEDAIKEVTSQDLLILLDALDGRQVVSTAARQRAEELTAETEEVKETVETEETEVTPESGE